MFLFCSSILNFMFFHWNKKIYKYTIWKSILVFIIDTYEFIEILQSWAYTSPLWGYTPLSRGCTSTPSCGWTPLSWGFCSLMPSFLLFPPFLRQTHTLIYWQNQTWMYFRSNGFIYIFTMLVKLVSCVCSILLLHSNTTWKLNLRHCQRSSSMVAISNWHLYIP